MLQYQVLVTTSYLTLIDTRQKDLKLSDAWNYPNQQSLLARGVYLTLNLCLYLSFTQIAMLSQLLQAGAVNCQIAAPIYEKNVGCPCRAWNS